MTGALGILPILCLGLGFGAGAAWAQNTASTDPALQAVIEQNRLLQEQVKVQQKTIEALNAQVRGDIALGLGELPQS